MSSLLRILLVSTLFVFVSALYVENSNLRIIGGSAAPRGSVPYQVSLRSYFHFCGGSIISSKTILTAAHCLATADSRNVYAVVGTDLLYDGGDTYRAIRLIIHPEYSPSLITNDIGLALLAEAIRFSPSVQSIPIETAFLEGGVDVILTGWGTTSYPSGSSPNDLQTISLKTISTQECSEKLFPNDININQICTLTKSGEGACHGDSGGPLVANGQQVGIVSWGKPCAIGSPDVFTRVSSFASWINANSVP